MPTETIELTQIVPAAPERIYAAWLDAREHSAMTGGEATVESGEIGGRFTAWNGYIDGSHLALEPGRRIVQSWRSDDFPADALDSHLEVRLEPVPGGTRLTIVHSDLPAGQGPANLEGWEAHYLEPMRKYFGARPRSTRRGAAAARKKKATRRATATGRTPPRRGRPVAKGAPRPARAPRRGKAGRRGR
jgi:uncharacterized protein YndB with AHSA1/START domain